MSLPPPLPLNTGRASSIVICAIVFPVLATVTVIARFFARKIRKVGYGADDYIIVLALLAVYAQMTIIIMSTYYGGCGHHIEELQPSHIIMFYKLIAAVQFSFGSSLGLVKISFCCLLIRVFFSRRFKITAFCVMAYCTCWMLMTIFIGVGLCRPFAYNWNRNIPGGRCGNADGAYISIAALDILGDSMIIALPMPMIWKLNAGAGTKIGLSFLFALGFLDIIVAILRIVYLTNVSFVSGTDFTWDATGTYVWSVIEPSLAVIVACGAVLKPLFESLLPSIRSLVSYGKALGYGTGQSSKNAQRLPDRTSDSDIPLHNVDRRTQLGHGGPSAQHKTYATGGGDTFLDLENDEGIWVQREVSVQQTSHN